LTLLVASRGIGVKLSASFSNRSISKGTSRVQTGRSSG